MARRHPDNSGEILDVSNARPEEVEGKVNGKGLCSRLDDIEAGEEEKEIYFII